MSVREFLARESPKIRSEFILKGNIKISEDTIPKLKNLLRSLKAGERPFAVQIGGVTYLLPEVKHVERDLKTKQEKLPKLRRWLKEVQKRKKLRKMM